jgi:hypothetical protein
MKSYAGSKLTIIVVNFLFLDDSCTTVVKECRALASFLERVLGAYAYGWKDSPSDEKRHARMHSCSTLPAVLVRGQSAKDTYGYDAVRVWLPHSFSTSTSYCTLYAPVQKSLTKIFENTRFNSNFRGWGRPVLFGGFLLFFFQETGLSYVRKRTYGSG